MRLIASGCKCSADPYIICPAHPCLCARCKKTTGIPECEWRKLHLALITKKLCGPGGISHDELIAQFADKLAYLALIELAGYEGPSSCRERSMLNILSLLPEMHPLDAMPNIVDKSQTIVRGNLRHDGAACTIGTNSSLWSFADARALTAGEVAKLMGHDPSTIKCKGGSESSFRELLGQSLHVAAAGLMMTSFMASLANDPE